MDAALDSHEDTTTTDYDSGDSGRVGYAYEGGKATVSSKQLAKAASPRRKPKSRSPKGKPRITNACYACGAPQSPPESDPDVNESTEFEEDTDVEGSVEHRSRPARRRLSGPEEAGAREEKDRGRKRSQRSDSKKSTKPVAHKQTPYIEEYPEDEAQRPVILLKEHKLPRRFSASDAKSGARDSVEDHKDAGASSRGRSPTGKRLPANAATQGVQPPKKQSTTPRRRRSGFQAVPGGKFSDSELGSSESESEQTPVKALEASPPRRRTLEASPPHHKALEESPQRRKALEESPPRRQSRGSHPPADLPSAVARSSAWPEHPQYSSSWPLQSGSHYVTQQPRADHGYESEDESDDDAGNGHRHLPTKQHTVSGNNQQIRSHQEQQRQHQHHRHTSQQQHQQQQQHHQQPQHVNSGHHQKPQAVPRPINNPPRRPTRERDETPQPPNPRPRQPRPPRPIVARTVVSQRSMATMDRAGTGRDSVAASLCDIWRGRPEDWESPYSSSEDEYASDLDGERAPAMRMIEGSPQRSGRELSVASYYSRRERDPSTARARVQRPMEAAAGFLRRSDATTMVPAAWERCESPERMAEDDEMRLEVSRRRGVSRARSRWTMAEYGGGRGRSPSPAPPVRRWTVDTSGFRGRSKSRGREPVFSARKTREFLSPKPKRAEKFDFDAWGRERASRSMLALGLGLA
ncbi:hypothetical protein B0T16DRAFT_396262 [Cercophora newfieldiana]|uniref:Uncharacterized protein n=1 Tax=Cercophora newfieldiana TaxID=92897 RepID=A0AA39YMB9_9PEZI|nr:hypothetical protein B0T16DRAFT_396262 [Cercophora newfieldiana]